MLSKCCRAVANTIGSGEGTYYAVCLKCGQACDVVVEPTKPQSVDEILELAHIALRDECQPCYDRAKAQLIELVKSVKPEFDKDFFIPQEAVNEYEQALIKAIEGGSE